MEQPETLIDRFSILPVTEESKAPYEQLFELEGEALGDALSNLVMSHPAVVGANYRDPGALYWRDDEDALRYGGGDNPTCREEAQHAYERWAKEHGKPCPAWPEEALDLYERWAELHGFARPEWEAVQDQKVSATHASRPNLQGEGHDRPVSSYRCGRSR